MYSFTFECLQSIIEQKGWLVIREELGRLGLLAKGANIAVSSDESLLRLGLKLTSEQNTHPKHFLQARRKVLISSRW